jgi:phosphate transport system substrate-binding protein
MSQSLLTVQASHLSTLRGLFMKLSVIHILVAGALSAGGLGQALAQQEATGAGDSITEQLYSKWAAENHNATGVKNKK